MKEQEKNQHAMTTFALLGGLFLAPRPKSQGTLSDPQTYRPFEKK